MDEMWRWFKRSGIVHGERLQSAWRWKTSSGNVMQAEPGDWRLWDSKDPEHRWSITPCELELTYRQVAPGCSNARGAWRRVLRILAKWWSRLRGMQLHVTETGWYVLGRPRGWCRRPCLLSAISLHVIHDRHRPLGSELRESARQGQEEARTDARRRRHLSHLLRYVEACESIGALSPMDTWRLIHGSVRNCEPPCQNPVTNSC